MIENALPFLAVFAVGLVIGYLGRGVDDSRRANEILRRHLANEQQREMRREEQRTGGRPT